MTVDRILKFKPHKASVDALEEEPGGGKTHLRSGRLVLYPGIQPAMVQLFLAVHLLQEPLGLNQRPSVPAHPSSQP